MDAIDGLRSRLQAYNTALSVVDAAYAALQETEKSVGEFSEDMLIGVASKFGKNSYEYEMAGGVRRSAKKRPLRKAKADTP